MITIGKPRFTGRTWMRLAMAVEGLGEVLQMICFGLFGAIVYAMFTNSGTGPSPLSAPPTGLVVAAAAVGFTGMPATLLAPVLRTKGLRLLAAARQPGPAPVADKLGPPAEAIAEPTS